jgi:hypothetical protein
MLKRLNNASACIARTGNYQGFIRSIWKKVQKVWPGICIPCLQARLLGDCTKPGLTCCLQSQDYMWASKAADGASKNNNEQGLLLPEYPGARGEYLVEMRRLQVEVYHQKQRHAALIKFQSPW